MTNDNDLKIPDKTIDKVYDDALHPVASETGKLLARIPRTINAIFSSFDKWLLKKEYNVSQTQRFLENALSSVDPDKIVSPEPYIAIPALQYISYSASSKELYNLYATLLSKAMYADTKDLVHPAFIEIIRQFSPSDALVLKEFSLSEDPIPAATFSIVMRIKGIHFVGQSPEQRTSSELVTNISPSILSEQRVQISIDNLIRLGLISLLDISLSEENKYDFAKNTELYSRFQQEFEKLNRSELLAERILINKKILSLTSFGKLFCDICIHGFH